MAKKRKKKTRSWFWVIFWFILVWPIGLVLLFKKIHSDKSAVFNDCNKATTMSFVLAGLGIIILINAFAVRAGVYGFLWALALIGGGIWVFLVAKKMKADGERYKKYIAIIINQNQTSIDKIASALGVPYNVVESDLLKMISAGYFQGAYIDTTKREIVLPQTTAPQQNQETAPNTPVQAAQEQMSVVTCKSCGANNRALTGQSVECEYCGTPLQ